MNVAKKKTAKKKTKADYGGTFDVCKKTDASLKFFNVRVSKVTIEGHTSVSAKLKACPHEANNTEPDVNYDADDGGAVWTDSSIELLTDGNPCGAGTKIVSLVICHKFESDVAGGIDQYLTEVVPKEIDCDRLPTCRTVRMPKKKPKK